MYLTHKMELAYAHTKMYTHTHSIFEATVNCFSSLFYFFVWFTLWWMVLVWDLHMILILAQLIPLVFRSKKAVPRNSTLDFRLLATLIYGQ